MKQSVYIGDLGLVESVMDGKAWIRLVPRLDLKGQYSNKTNDQKKPGKEADKSKRYIRIPQKFVSGS